MNTPDIKITSINPSEWSRLRAIRLEALSMEPHAFNSKYPEVLNKSGQYWIDELSDPNKLYLFAEVDGDIVGTMNCSFNENNISNEVVIHGAYVNIRQRRKGIGKKLLTALIEEAKTHQGVKNAKLWVKGSQIKARKLYESIGFSVTGKDGENTLIMEKSLV